jgi:hypothetical protein
VCARPHQWLLWTYSYRNSSAPVFSPHFDILLAGSSGNWFVLFKDQREMPQSNEMGPVPLSNRYQSRALFKLRLRLRMVNIKRLMEWGMKFFTQFVTLTRTEGHCEGILILLHTDSDIAVTQYSMMRHIMSIITMEDQVLSFWNGSSRDSFLRLTSKSEYCEMAWENVYILMLVSYRWKVLNASPGSAWQHENRPHQGKPERIGDISM